MALPKLVKGLKRRSKAGGDAKHSGLPFSPVRGSRFVLFLGDEGAILVYLTGNKVNKRQFVPDSGEQNLNELRATLAEDPKAPVEMIIDTMDQTYIQQTLPPVSALSVGRLIRRRLDRDFGANDIKGAVVLGREMTGRKDWNFIMVGIEYSTQLSLWFDFLETLPNRFDGIYLVSVEAELIIKSLDKAMGVPAEGTGSEWKFLVSHNKVGGFRQVILRNGKIIFTRMAQPIGESTPEVIAGNIEQEILGTIEYMRRLSYTPQAGLDVYIIASSAVKPLIDASKFNASNTQVLSPYEVAGHLGIEGATQPTDQFGDVILAAAIGASRKHVLKLSTQGSKQFDTLYQALIYQRMAAAAAGIMLFLYTGGILVDIYNSHSESSDLEQKKTVQQQSITKLETEIKEANLDLEKANDLINLYTVLIEQRISPMPFIAKLQQTIHPPIVVKEITWAIDRGSDTVGKGKPLPKMTTVLTMEFPGVTTLEGFRMVSKKLLEELNVAFQGYTISFTKLPSVFSESSAMNITFDEREKTNQPLDVELTIQGEVMLATVNPPPAAGASE